MTSVKRPAAALMLLTALALGGCGDAGDPPSPAAATESQLQAAIDRLDELQAATESLEDEVTELRDDRSDAARRIDAVSGRLWSSIAKLRASLRDLEDESSGAIDRAASALASVQEVARDLAVLDSRLDYHLTHSSR